MDDRAAMDDGDVNDPSPTCRTPRRTSAYGTKAEVAGMLPTTSTVARRPAMQYSRHRPVSPKGGSCTSWLPLRPRVEGKWRAEVARGQRRTGPAWPRPQPVRN
jgi:hypothetical protein